MDNPRRNFRHLDAVIVAGLVLQLVLWIYSQGKLWQAVQDVRDDVHEIKALLLKKAIGGG